MNFHNITIEDKTEYNKYVIKENSKSADFSFANVFMWDKKYNQQLSYNNDMAIIKIGSEYRIPIGSNSIINAIKDLKTDDPLVFKGLTDEMLDKIKNLDYNHYIIPDRNYSDYIYDIDDLISLRGKKLHAKRNHINKFFETYNDYRFMELDYKMFDDCLSILDSWADNVDINIVEEHEAIKKAFEYYKELDLFGAILYVYNKPVGFCIGEVISSDTFCIHYEKSTIDAYAFINNEFVKMIKFKYPFIKYVNREDDMGLLNLRKAKLSYKPMLVNKYNLYIIDKWIVDECKKLYIKTFNDDISYVDKLFENYAYSLRYIIEDNKVISMLFGIDISVNGRDFKYIYGACTDYEYQNKGYMKKLINSIKNYPLCLKPANKDLFDFYSKLGFNVISNKTIKEYDVVDMIIDLNEIDYKELRNNYINNNYPLLDNRYIDLALNIYKASGNSNGIALYEVKDDYVFIIEYFGDINICNMIALKEGKKKYVVKNSDDIMAYNINAFLNITLD